MSQAVKYFTTGRQLRDEVLKETGRDVDAGYLLNIRSGNRKHNTLGPIIAKIEARYARQAKDVKVEVPA